MGIVWRDKVLSSYHGNIESVIVHDADGNEVEVPNGVFVTLDGTLGREVKRAVLAGAEDATAEVLLVASPEVVYDGSDDLADFVNEEGAVARAFRLADGDVITLTEDLFAEGTTLSVGTKLAVSENGLLGAIGEGVEPRIKFVVREDARNELARGTQAWRLDVVK